MDLRGEIRRVLDRELSIANANFGGKWGTMDRNQFLDRAVDEMEDVCKRHASVPKIPKTKPGYSNIGGISENFHPEDH